MAKRSNSIKNPLIGKEVLRTSPTVVMRFRQPTNPFTAGKVHTMVFDYSDQRRVWPNGKPDALIEATQQTGTKYDTINKSGHPFALGNIEVGGDAAESNGDAPFARVPSKKMLK